MTALAQQRAGHLWLVVLAATMVMGLGGLMTDQGPWYQSLAKPAWRPPGWLFGPVWAVILALVVTSFLICWPRVPGEARAPLLFAYALNAALNILWSALFFRFRRPDLAFADVTAVWLSIGALIVLTWRHSRVAALLLGPYLAWVWFAAILNLEILRLNGPFS
jgi:tryptophan-rich sensory protein